ncbi:MAG: cysteine--tRNA ligase [Phycisphaeraceae bacterium]|nr:cysteine--tRNA ligase [Phycisphaeraceae bacterium]MCW5753261.1 cysteine--tRNA ligase [Phycisphaeraceae bacterium]
MPLTIYNTLTRSARPFAPADPKRITFYTCGLTVYDDGHIGNFRSFLAADLLRRWLESPLCELVNDPAGSPRRVVHVMNITDVGHMTDDDSADGGGEDKMAAGGRRIAEAKKSGKLPPGVEIDPTDPRAVAEFFTGRFLRDARDMGLKVAIEQATNPLVMPRATDHVPGMIVSIERLISRGHAYVVGSPGSRVVYFDVRSLASYGALSGNTLDRLREGEGGRVRAENQAGKRHPSDFLLWKEDRTHLMKWPSPWGEGYPGWHIECTAMAVRCTHPEAASLDLRTFTVPDGLPIFDIHSGGEDNIFPHHECEIAQSCAAFNALPEGAPLARLWFHPRFLLINGEKMSKSKGNFATVRQLIDQGHEAAAIRLELIKTHYRSNANFTDQGLKDSARLVERWRRMLDAADQARAHSPEAGDQAARDRCRAEFAAAMNDDLNIAGAIAALNRWANEVREPLPGDGVLLRELDAVLGLFDRPRAHGQETDIGVFAPGVEPDPRVIDLLLARREARARKDFASSDRIRDELAAMGYAIKDVAGGRVEVRRA